MEDFILKSRVKDRVVILYQGEFVFLTTQEGFAAARKRAELDALMEAMTAPCRGKGSRLRRREAWKKFLERAGE